MSLYFKDAAEHRRYFANWLRYRWNTEHVGNDPLKQVKSLEIVFNREVTPPPGQPATPAEAMKLWDWIYE